MGQNASSSPRNAQNKYSLEYIEHKHSIQQNATRASNASEFYVGDTVIIRQSYRTQMRGLLTRAPNDEHTVTNESQGQEASMIDEGMPPHLTDETTEMSQSGQSIPESSQLDQSSIEKHSSSQRISADYDIVTMDDLVGLDDDGASSPVHTIESIASHPTQSDLLLLRLTGLNSLIPSNEVTLLSTRQNRLRHQYHWLLFLYLDLCNSLSENDSTNVAVSPTSDSLPLQQHIIPDEIVVNMLRTHAAKGEPIQRLNLSDRNLTDKCVIPILFLVKRLRHLIRLDLSKNQLTWRFCENLVHCLAGHNNAQQPSQFGLSELDISFNRCIGNRGAEYLSHGLKSEFCSLHYLNVENTGITSEGASILLQSIIDNPHSVLVKLNIRQCGVSDDQILLALSAAKKHSSLCFFDAYPHLPDQKKSSSGWLSMKGWNAYAALRDVLTSNMNSVKTNPQLLQPTLHNETKEQNRGKNFVEFLNYINQTYISKLFFDTNGVESELGKEESSRLPFQEWKAAQKRHEEWKRWQQDDQDFESYFDETSHREPSRVSGDWLVVEPPKDAVASPISQLVDLPHHERVSSFDQDMMKVLSGGLASSGILDNSMTNLSASSVSSSGEPIIECKICFEDKLPKDIYIIDQCEHKFCATCIRTYVLCKINSFESDSIKCPSCHRSMEQAEIRQILSLNSANAKDDEQLSDEELLQKYTDFTLKKALMKMKGLIWCPNHDCKNAVLFKGPEIPQRRKAMQKKQQSIEGSIREDGDNEENSTPPPHEQRPSSSLLHMEQHVNPRLMRRFYPGFFDHQYRFDSSDLESTSASSMPHRDVGTVSQALVRRFYSSNSLVEDEGNTLTSSTTSASSELLASASSDNLASSQSNDISASPTFPPPLPMDQYQAFRVQCSECKTLICGMCKSFFHPEASCEEFRHRHEHDAERKALDEWMQDRDVKNCPQCHCVIEKRGGCNHVTCKNCTCEFCWICSKILVGEEIKNHFSILGMGGCKKWTLAAVFT